MNSIGTYISSVVEKGFRRLKFRRFGRDDIMTAYLGTSFGEDYIPSSGKVVQIGTTNSNENVIICTVRKADETLNVGDKVIYSTDADGNVKTRIYLRNDGTVEVKGDTVVFQDGEDFAVRYSKLQSEFDELKERFNSLVSTWNTFATAYVPGSPSTLGTPPTASTATQSSADITQAKIDKIKVP
jgi:hypothetical protein